MMTQEEFDNIKLEDFRRDANAFHDASIAFLNELLAMSKPGSPEYYATLQSMQELQELEELEELEEQGKL